MTPFYLSFPNEADGRKELAKALLLLEVDDGAGGTQPAQSANLNIIGRKRQPPVFGDKLDADGNLNVLKPSVLLDEWRANLLADELPESLKPYAVNPVSPDVVFAGFSPEDIAKESARLEQLNDE